MADYSDRLALQIVVDDSGGVAVIKGFGSTTSTELSKVEGDAKLAGSNAGTAFGNEFTSGATTALAGVAQATAGLGLATSLISAAQAGGQLAASQAALGAILKSTGNAADIPKSHIEDLAAEMEKSDAIFKGTTIQAAAVLATFEAVRNNGGVGGDIFDRALKDAANLTGVLQTDLPAAAAQLGRALENPITGLLALSRAKVGFDQATRNNILSLAKEGDLQGAQIALLDAVEKKYNGVAAAVAAADPFKQISVDFKDFQTQIGTDVLPVFRLVAEGGKDAANAFTDLPNGIRATIEAGAGLVALSATISGVARVAATLNTALGGGAAAAGIGLAEQAQTAALGGLVTAGAAAAEAQANLDAVVATGTVDMSAYAAAEAEVVASTEALAAADAQAVASQEALNAARTASAGGLGAQIAGYTGVGLVLGVATVGTRLLLEQTDKLFDNSGTHFKLDTAISSLHDLGTEGKATGLIADALGDKFQHVKQAIDAAGDSSFGNKLTLSADVIDKALSGSSSTKLGDYDAVNALDKALAQLAGQGGQNAGIAAAAFAKIKVEADASGVSASTLARAFNDYTKAAKESASVDPFGALQGQVQLAESAYENLLAKQAGGADVSTNALAAARQNLITVTQKQSTVEAQVQAAEAASEDAADGTSDAVLTLSQSLAQLDGTAQGTVDALTSLVNGPLAALTAQSTIGDSFDKVDAAYKKLQGDQADAAGDGDKTVAAVQAEKDAYNTLVNAINSVATAKQALGNAYYSLTQAQDTVTSSAHSLLEAQQALDEYNSARGAEERGLELDIIQRRVVTTPEGEDQKRLDLLKNQDSNASQQQQLQDQVTSAQTAYQSALHGVITAEQGVASAQDAVKKSTTDVQTAEDKLAIAIKKRQEIHATATAAIKSDEAAVQAAILTTAGAIDQAAGKGLIFGKALDDDLLKLQAFGNEFAPGSKTSQDIDAFYAKLITQEATAAGGAASFFAQFGGTGNGVLSDSTLTRLLAEITSGQPIPPGDKTLLHQLKVPGFAEGGIVPGPAGLPQLIVAHGGERVQTKAQQASGAVVHQENNFYGESGTAADIAAANARLAWQLASTGRGS